MRVLVGQSIGILLLFISFTTHAQVTQTTGTLTAVDLEVAGVKLGMTADEATAALKEFSPDTKISSRSEIGPEDGYNDVGIDRTSEAPDPKAYLIGLQIEKGREMGGCAVGGGVCTDKYEHIGVWFSPIPGQERVIAVQRTIEWNTEKPHPTVADIEASVFEKAPKASATIEGNDNSPNPSYFADWDFDAKGRLISSGMARKKGLRAYNGNFPGTVFAGDGSGLSVEISPDGRNPLLTATVNMTLYDANALYLSHEQSVTTSKTLSDKANLEAAKKASAAVPQTKF